VVLEQAWAAGERGRVGAELVGVLRRGLRPGLAEAGGGARGDAVGAAEDQQVQARGAEQRRSWQGRGRLCLVRARGECWGRLELLRPRAARGGQKMSGQSEQVPAEGRLAGWSGQRLGGGGNRAGARRQTTVEELVE
jgi:hypothetical protein